jgi:hypothetical protein
MPLPFPPPLLIYPWVYIIIIFMEFVSLCQILSRCKPQQWATPRVSCLRFPHSTVTFDCCFSKSGCCCVRQPDLSLRHTVTQSRWLGNGVQGQYNGTCVINVYIERGSISFYCVLDVLFNRSWRRDNALFIKT